MKRPALQSKRVGVSRMAFRARKDFRVFWEMHSRCHTVKSALERTQWWKSALFFIYFIKTRSKRMWNPFTEVSSFILPILGLNAWGYSTDALWA